MSADPRVGAAEATDSLVDLAYEWDLTVPQARAAIDLCVDAIEGVASSDATAGLADAAVVAAYVHILDHHVGTGAAQICEAQAGRALADGVDAPASTSSSRGPPSCAATSIGGAVSSTAP